MHLLDLLRRETDLPLRQFLLVSAVAGLATVLLLAVVNAAALAAASATPAAPLFLVFLAGFVLHGVSQERAVAGAMAEVEEVLHRVRLRLAGKVRRAELLALERVGRTDIYASIDKETSAISEASLVLVLGSQSALVVIFASLYLAWLSPLAFAVAVPFVGLAVWINLRRESRERDALRRGLDSDNELFTAISDLVDGFAEVKLHSGRSDALQADIVELSARARSERTAVRTRLASAFVVSQANFYLLVGAMVFVVPQLVPTAEGVVVQATTTALFALGPIFSVLRALPELSLANVAAENVRRLEARLDAAAGPPPGAEPFVPRAEFERIELAGVVFRYRTPGGETSFTVGPLDLELRRGELLLISGGNGSGKSTLLRVLTGLYPAAEGEVRVDGVAVRGAAAVDAYRSLFTVIFTDDHVFRRLYGLGAVDEARFSALLADLELTGKTGLADGELTQVTLSSGERKRLALALGQLEDRPIFVFDEWAVHQEPVFRARFYREILPRLRAAGKTVVVVTHDERYFDVAERHLAMRDGHLIEPAATPGRAPAGGR